MNPAQKIIHVRDQVLKGTETPAVPKLFRIETSNMRLMLAPLPSLASQTIAKTQTAKENLKWKILILYIIREMMRMRALKRERSVNKEVFLEYSNRRYKEEHTLWLLLYEMSYSLISQ